MNQIYDPALEEHWAQISNVLLLKVSCYACLYFAQLQDSNHTCSWPGIALGFEHLQTLKLSEVCDVGCNCLDVIHFVYSEKCGILVIAAGSRPFSLYLILSLSIILTTS